MHRGRLIIEINVVKNYISDNFYFDHKVVLSNLMKLFFLNLMNTLKIMIYPLFGDFPTVDISGFWTWYSMESDPSIVKKSAE